MSPLIFHLHDRLSARGGAERHLLAVLRRQQGGRARTHLLVGRDDGSLPPDERGGIGPWSVAKGLDRGGLSPRGGQAAARRLEEALRRSAPDVVHAHNVMDPALIALAASWGRGVMTVQDHRLFCPGLGKVTPEGAVCGQVMGPGCLACFREADYGGRVLELTRARLMAAAGMAAVTVLSDYMAHELRRAWASLDITAPPVTVIPPMVDGLGRAAEGPGGGPPGAHHLLAGRLVERKGVRVALAAAEMLSQGPGLVVAGDGPLAGEAAAAARRSPGRVRFAGWQDRAGMARLISEAVSLWMPSLWAEPFGIAGLEAMALGKPVLASAVGGVGQWLEPGLTGALLPPGDARCLALAADGLAARPGLARAMGGRGARACRREFAPAPLMARLWRVYGNAAQDAFGGAREHPGELKL